MQKITLTLLLTLTLAFSLYATTPKTTSASPVNWKNAEKNYIVALQSDNAGLRKSAANYLAEYRLSGAVQTLITVLQNDKVEQLRMAAALALVQIGNKEGIDAVKDAVIYDGSEKVSQFCDQLIKTSTGDVVSMK